MSGTDVIQLEQERLALMKQLAEAKNTILENQQTHATEIEQLGLAGKRWKELAQEKENFIRNQEKEHEEQIA